MRAVVDISSYIRTVDEHDHELVEEDGSVYVSFDPDPSWRFLPENRHLAELAASGEEGALDVLCDLFEEKGKGDLVEPLLRAHPGWAVDLLRSPSLDRRLKGTAGTPYRYSVDNIIDDDVLLTVARLVGNYILWPGSGLVSTLYVDEIRDAIVSAYLKGDVDVITVEWDPFLPMPERLHSMTL